MNILKPLILILFFGLTLPVWAQTTRLPQTETRPVIPEWPLPVFDKREFNVIEFGAEPNNQQKFMTALNGAIDECHQAGGGRVRIPKGIWLSGPIHLKSNVNLHLDEGAEVRFSQKFDDYLPVVLIQRGGFFCYNYSPFIYARNQSNIAITGRGTLNGQGQAWWPWKKKQPGMIELFRMGKARVPVEQRVFGTEEAGVRPPFIQFLECQDIFLEGVTLLDGPSWNVHPVFCENVTIKGIKIHSHGPNNDGIDPDGCKNVRIEDCLIDVGDDNICLKSGRDEEAWEIGRPCENVIVRRCTTVAGHGGFVIGSEMSAGVRNVIVEDCHFRGTQRGLRFKSRLGRGGVVENIFIRNITMDSIRNEAIIADLQYDGEPIERNMNYERIRSQDVPVFRNFSIENVTCRYAKTAVLLRGLPEDSTIYNLRFKNIRIQALNGISSQHIQSVSFENVQIESVPPGIKIGRIQPRHAREIKASNWSVGAETMDRDFTIYANWRAYLGPLGFKKARVQSGWMRTELTKGKYDWEWLDNIVDDMNQQGVRPWLSLSYGNPLYCTFEGDSRGDIPRTPEAKNAWANYVEAIVERYKDKVLEWEIWNEPRMGKGITPEEYADLVIQTATIIKRIQPHSKVIILALDHSHLKALVDEDFCAQKYPQTIETKKEAITCVYARRVMDLIKEAEKLYLIDILSYHPYEFNPDEITDVSLAFRSFAKSYGSHISIFQGECGVPSEINQKRALANFPWTERSQAKWALRRLLNDAAYNIPSSYFSIADMCYNDEINRKGLLKSRPDKTIEKPKLAYYALQNLAAIFDETLQPTRRELATMQSNNSLALFAFEDKNNLGLVALWLKDEIPSDEDRWTVTDVMIDHTHFEDPVYVDLLTGEVRQLRTGQSTNYVTLKNIRIPDYPVLIADRKLLNILP